MEKKRDYTVEVVAFDEELEATEAKSNPMSLEATFYRRNREIRKLADNEDLDVRTAKIVDARGGRF